jgi:hypothetical protein
MWWILFAIRKTPLISPEAYARPSNAVNPIGQVFVVAASFFG